MSATPAERICLLIRLPLIALLALALVGLAPAPAGRAEDLPAGEFGVARRAQGMELVGALRLDPADGGVHGDVAAYKNLAFVGKWRGPCPGTGVDIVDIGQPGAAQAGRHRGPANTSMEDMEAMAIGGRDVLAIGLQACAVAAGRGWSWSTSPTRPGRRRSASSRPPPVASTSST